MRDCATRFRIKFNSIHTLRGVEDDLLRHCAVGGWFNLDDELGAKLLFLNESPSHRYGAERLHDNPVTSLVQVGILPARQSLDVVGVET